MLERLPEDIKDKIIGFVFIRKGSYRYYMNDNLKITLYNDNGILHIAIEYRHFTNVNITYIDEELELKDFQSISFEDFIRLDLE